MFKMMYDLLMATEKKKVKEKNRLCCSRVSLLNKSLKLFSMQVMIVMVVLVVPSKGDNEQHYCLQTNIDYDNFKTEAPIEAQVEMIRMLAGAKAIEDEDIAMISDDALQLLNLSYYWKHRDNASGNNGNRYHNVRAIDLESEEWFGIPHPESAGFQDQKAFEAWRDKFLDEFFYPDFMNGGSMANIVTTYCRTVRYRKALQVLVTEFPTVFQWFTGQAGTTRQVRLKAFFRVFVRLIAFTRQTLHLLELDKLTLFLHRVHLWQVLCGQSSEQISSECTSLLAEEVVAQRRRVASPPKATVLPIWLQAGDGVLLRPLSTNELQQRPQSAVVLEKLNAKVVDDYDAVQHDPAKFAEQGDEEILAFRYRALLLVLWPGIETEASAIRITTPAPSPTRGETKQTGQVKETTTQPTTVGIVQSKRKCSGNKCVWALGSLGVAGAVGGGAYYGYPYVKTWIGKLIDDLFGAGNKSTTTAAPIQTAIRPNHTNNTEVTSSSGQSSVLWIVPFVVVIALLLLIAFVAYYYGLFGSGKNGSDSNKSSHSGKLHKSAKSFTQNTGKANTSAAEQVSVRSTSSRYSSVKHSNKKSKSSKPMTPTGAIVSSTTTSSANVSTKKSQKKEPVVVELV